MTVRPITSTYAPRHDAIHDFRTGVVKYWVDIPPKMLDGLIFIPMLGDYLTGLIVEDLYSHQFIKFTICIDGALIACDNKWQIEYSNATKHEYIYIHIDNVANLNIFIRAEYLLLANEPSH